jgi:protein ImuB
VTVMTRAVRTLVVWCPDWPVAAAGHPASAPVAVVHANRVVACSAAAREDGVTRGLRRREAQSRCPALLVVEQDLGRDARAFEPVVAAVEVFTPRVEVVRAGVVAMATRGPSRYFGGDQALAAKVVAAVDAVLEPRSAPGCRVGVADGPFAAELAARGTPGGPLGVTGPAAGAGAAGAARAVTVVPAGSSAAFLAPLPVTVLDRPELADLLARLGLGALGNLAALPAGTVLARFGTEGVLAHRLARGLDERPLAVRIPPPDFTVTVELDPPAERVDTAAFAAKAMADELHERLAGQGLACTRIAIEAETEHGENLVRLWRHDGALTPGAIAERVRWQLDGWLSSGAATAGLTLLRLIPDEVKPDHGRQLGFWGGSAAADDRAARALARVQGMLGPEGVLTAVVGGGRDPADQVRLVPWGDPREPARPGAPNPDPVPAGRLASGGPDAGGFDGRPATGAHHSVKGGAIPASVSGPAGPSRATRRQPRRTMGAAANEVPPWPGHLPLPAPAVVYLPPLAVEVRDGSQQPVTVTARGLLSGGPVAVSMAGGPWIDVAAWAGPWPAEERWWDTVSARRRARLQICLEDGTAHLVARESGRWQVEATYD